MLHNTTDHSLGANIGNAQGPEPEKLSSEYSTIAILTPGQKLVGLTFNPSNDQDVDYVKRLFAEIADIVYAKKQNPNQEQTHLEQVLFPHVLGEILNAQMNVVKLLTLKY